jgi:hypothetical protein
MQGLELVRWHFMQSCPRICALCFGPFTIFSQAFLISKQGWHTTGIYYTPTMQSRGNEENVCYCLRDGECLLWLIEGRLSKKVSGCQTTQHVRAMRMLAINLYYLHEGFESTEDIFVC